MSLSTLKIILILLVGALAVVTGVLLLVAKLRKKEPYRSFLMLPTRRKIGFLKGIITDKRVPWTAKALIPLTILYLAMPFDLIPDFIPVLGEMDDIAVILVNLALFIRLCPKEVVQEHLQRAVSP